MDEIKKRIDRHKQFETDKETNHFQLFSLNTFAIHILHKYFCAIINY